MQKRNLPATGSTSDLFIRSENRLTLIFSSEKNDFTLIYGNGHSVSRGMQQHGVVFVDFVLVFQPLFFICLEQTDLVIGDNIGPVIRLTYIADFRKQD